MKKYDNPESFRKALEDRISNIAKKEEVDIQRLRRDVAFDRLLVRLFKMPSPPWALKGGYAMQLRTESARSTKDIDLALKEAKLFSEDENKRNAAVRDLLIKQASIDLGDFFSFLISEPTQESNAAPEGGGRFHVTARLADRDFQKFLLDVGMGDVWSDPLDQLDSSDFLKFAGFEPQKLPAIPKEQQFAEKLHAYSLPRTNGRENSRVKDLIDMNLLIQAGLSEKRLMKALNETFKRRNTHPLSLNVQPPPKSWTSPYAEMAEECGLDADIDVGFQVVVGHLKGL
jgi:hypothetical protein